MALTLHRRDAALVFAIFVANFLATYNLVALNVALPSFIQVFQCDLRIAQWFIVGFALAQGVLSPTAGFFADRFSCRNLFAAAMLGFGLTALLAGFSQTPMQMIVLRFAQGVTAAFIIPCSMMVIYQYIARRQQTTFLTMQGIAGSLAVSVGPVLAGYLLTVTDWRWLFWMNAPLALLTAYAIYRVVPMETLRQEEHLDFLGFGMVILGSVMVLLSFTMAEDWGFFSARMTALLMVGAMLVVAFIRRTLKQREPLLNFRVLRYDDFRRCFIINITYAMAICVGSFLMAIYFQTILGMTPLQSGILIMLPSLMAIVTAPIGQMLYKRIPAWLLIMISLLALAAGNFFAGRLYLGVSLYFVLFWVGMRYVGIGLMGMPLSDVGMRVLPREMTSHGSALLNWCKTMSSSLAVSLFTMVYNLRTVHYSGEMPLPEAQIMGSNDTFMITAVMAVVSALLALRMRKAKAPDS